MIEAMTVGRPSAQPDAASQGPASRRFKSMAALAVGCGLLLRVWFLLHYSHVDGDSLIYGDIARNLLAHHVYGFSIDPGVPSVVRPTLIRLPGYPLFLALCFRLFGVECYVAVLLVQIAIDLTTCVLVSRLTGVLFGPRAMMATLWLAALCPFTANYAVAPLTETLTLFTIALTFAAMQRWRAALLADGPMVNRWLFLMSLALAYSVLLRPEQGLLAAIVVPAVVWMAKGRDSWWKACRPGLLLGVLTVLPLAPWAARNWHTFHVIQPLAPRYANDPGETNPAGFQRWYRTWAVDFASTDSVYWHYDGAPVLMADLPNRAFDSQSQYTETDEVLEEYNDTNVATPALDRRFNKLAAERIHSDPLRYYVTLPVARVLNMTLRPRTDMLPVPLEWWKFRTHPRTFLFASVYAVINLGYLVLAAMTAVRRRTWPLGTVVIAAMLLFVGARAAMLLTLDNSEPRYTLEFYPTLLVLGGATLARLTSRTDCP